MLRYRALFTLNRFNRYAIPLPQVLGTQRPDGARLPVLAGQRQGRAAQHLSDRLTARPILGWQSLPAARASVAG